MFRLKGVPPRNRRGHSLAREKKRKDADENPIAVLLRRATGREKDARRIMEDIVIIIIERDWEN